MLRWLVYNALRLSTRRMVDGEGRCGAGRVGNEPIPAELDAMPSRP